MKSCLDTYQYSVSSRDIHIEAYRLFTPKIQSNIRTQITDKATHCVILLLPYAPSEFRSGGSEHPLIVAPVHLLIVWGRSTAQPAEYPVYESCQRRSKPCYQCSVFTRRLKLTTIAAAAAVLWWLIGERRGESLPHPWHPNYRPNCLAETSHVDSLSSVLTEQLTWGAVLVTLVVHQHCYTTVLNYRL